MAWKCRIVSASRRDQSGDVACAAARGDASRAAPAAAVRRARRTPLASGPTGSWCHAARRCRGRMSVRKCRIRSAAAFDRFGASCRIGAVEDLDRVQRRQRRTRTRQVGGDLDEAPDVAGGDCLRAGRADGLGLARAERGGDVGMLHVVEAGRPAARVAVGNLHHAQVRHAGQQRPRCPADALRVREMAGVVVRDRQWTWPAEPARSVRAPRGTRRRRARARQTCASAASCARPRNAWPYSFIADPHPAALVTIASTSVGKARASAVCPLVRAICLAAVQRERAAAALALRDHDLDAVGRKHPQRRQRDLRRQCLLHAAGQQRYTRALQALRLRVRRHGDSLRQLTGQQSDHRSQARRQQALDALGHAAQACARPEQRRGLERVEQEPALQASDRAACAGLASGAERDDEAPGTARPTGTPSRSRGSRGSGRCAAARRPA